MTSVGITGHQMRSGIQWDWVRSEVREALGRLSNTSVLWTCLANGADTIAAQEALSLGMEVKAIIPHSRYADVFSQEDRQIFDDLLCRANETIEMAPVEDDEQAYLNAGLRVADLSDLLIVVWDGQPAAGKGGTGDIAEYAKKHGTSVIWLDTQNSIVREISEANLKS